MQGQGSVWEPDFFLQFLRTGNDAPARVWVRSVDICGRERCILRRLKQGRTRRARGSDRCCYYHRLLHFSLTPFIVPLHIKSIQSPSPRFRPNWPRRRARARATPLGGSLERRRGARPMQAPPARPGCAPAPLELGPHGHTPRAGHPGWASSAAARARAIARPRPPPRPTDAGAAAEAPAPRVAAACLASCTRPRRCPARP